MVQMRKRLRFCPWLPRCLCNLCPTIGAHLLKNWWKFRLVPWVRPHLAQAKDEDWGLKWAPFTRWEIEEPETGWKRITPLHEAERCGKSSCALVLYTKKWDPTVLPFRLSYWHSIHFKSSQNFSSLQLKQKTPAYILIISLLCRL